MRIQRASNYYPYVFCVAIVVCAWALTEPYYWGDSPDYADSIVAYVNGVDHRFWDFGHLFWRPLIWAVWTAFFKGDNPELWRIEIFSAMQMVTRISGLLAALMLTKLLRSLNITLLATCVAVLGFVFCNTILNFSQTGNSYAPGLACFVAAIYFGLKGGEHGSRLDIVLSGVFLAFTFCFWIAYLFAFPAALLAPLIIYGPNRKRVAALIITGIVLGAVLVICFGTGLFFAGVRTPAQLMEWISRAAHEEETKGLVRAIFGNAGAFVNMGNDGIVFKRYLIGDPLNPVSLTDLFKSSLLKLMFFYLFVASVGVRLLANLQGRRYLLLALTAAIPVFLFSVSYAGGEPNWPLAYAPFLFIAIAVALDAASDQAIRVPMIAAIVLGAGINFAALSHYGTEARKAADRDRLTLVNQATKPDDKVFLVTFTDSLVQFNRTYPFEPENAKRLHGFPVLVSPGTTQTRRWKEEFATRAMFAWSNGRDVWVSSRGFADRPESNWNWAEGDDKNVNWNDFPEFLNTLDVGVRIGNANGFTLILPTDRNKLKLGELSKRLDVKLRLE